MEKNYIDILVQSLEQKVKVLDKISDENKRQSEILKEEELDLEKFQASVDVKAELIEQVAFLDDGFETMYERVAAVLQQQRQTYQQEIMKLKQLIAAITEKTVTIQKEEGENRLLAEAQFSNTRKKVRQVKTSGQIARKYYDSMAKLNYVDPQFMDKKK